jgi:hypothetical protein
MSLRPAFPRAKLRPLAVLSLAAAPLLCHAQLSQNARKEIDGLLSAVGSSGCEFMRSGKAHPAAEAQQHLQKKYDYLATRDKLSSTEDFIVKAATRSSMTGEAYGIRCSGAPQQPSEEWLKARLKEIRAGQPR